MLNKVISYIVGIAAALSCNCLDASDVLYNNDALQFEIAHEMANLGSDLNNFGGAFLQSQKNTWNVYLKNKNDQAKIEQALKRILDDDNVMVTVLPARYGVSELKSIADRAAVILNIEGVSFFDRIDERKNRITIGVIDETALQRVIDELTRLNMPTDAFEFEFTRPPEFLTSLTDTVRPPIGGLRISWPLGLESLYGYCTLGVVTASASGSSQFLTNSHCSLSRWAATSTIYYQPDIPKEDPWLIGAALPIGAEILDPPLFSGESCPPGRNCRYSDALVAIGGESLGRGAIAKVRGWGDIEIIGASYRVAERHYQVMTGERLFKVGAITGETFGEVSKTCIDIPLPLADRSTLLCQNQVDRAPSETRYLSYWGDSGSAVFKKLSNSGEVALVGLLWGGSPGDGNYLYSPISSVERELGRQRICHSSTPCFSDP